MVSTRQHSAAAIELCSILMCLTDGGFLLLLLLLLYCLRLASFV